MIDIRLFGIVLAKMLLFGDEVEKNLYDWKTQKVTQFIDCSFIPYKQLIELCFDKITTANLASIYIVSMISHIGITTDTYQPLKLDLYYFGTNDYERIYYDFHENLECITTEVLLEGFDRIKEDWKFWKAKRDDSKQVDYFREYYSLNALVYEIKELAYKEKIGMSVETEGVVKWHGVKLLEILDPVLSSPKFGQKECDQLSESIVGGIKKGMFYFKEFYGHALLALGLLGVKNKMVTSLLLENALDTEIGEWGQVTAIESLLYLEVVEGFDQVAPILVELANSKDEMVRTVASRAFPRLGKLDLL